MTRARLQVLLSSALFAAVAPGCGASVFEVAEADGGGTDAATSDTGTTPVDSGTRPDAKPPLDTSTPIDTGSCTPVADNTACNEKVTYPCGLPIPTSSPPT